MTQDRILDVHRVRKGFGGVLAVNDASLYVTRVIGPNGAGKTTMFNLISGFLPTESGTIIFDGKRIDGRPAHAIARLGMVRTFQIPRALTRMTVLENMMLAATHQPGEVLGAAVVLPWVVSRHERKVREQALEILELVRLSHLARAYAGTLSGGQRKLLEFGRALMTEPQTLLLDEPMAGVAPVLAIQLLEHILQLRATRGTTFLVIEHDMEAIMAISDRIIVMDQGTEIADGTPVEIQQNEQVIEAYLGTPTQASRRDTAAVTSS
jgi:ABC-type branched-subunit amino acid transport system ATPase component